VLLSDPRVSQQEILQMIALPSKFDLDLRRVSTWTTLKSGIREESHQRHAARPSEQSFLNSSATVKQADARNCVLSFWPDTPLFNGSAHIMAPVPTGVLDQLKIN
jgi:hypothetical protein